MDLAKILKKYINNKNANYAIMIDGDWGCGKTFYIKHNLVKKHNNVLYVSLYGISNTDKLSRSICNEILVSKTFNSRLFRFFRKLWYKSLFFKVIFSPFYLIFKAINCVQKIIIWFISLILRNIFKIRFGVDVPLVQDKDYSSILDLFRHLDDYTLVVDDLERCPIPFDEIFGYLNNMVEHRKVKCIIIANENEVNKINRENYELKVLSVLNTIIDYSEPDIFEKNNKNSLKSEGLINYKEIEDRVKKIYEPYDKYKLIKEKLIGKTYKFIPNIDEVYDHVVFNYKDEPYKLISCLVKDDVVNTMKSQEYYNIRTLQFYADIYNDLCQIMKNKGIDNEDIKLISDSVLKTCIFYKKGYPLSYISNGLSLVKLNVNNTTNIFKQNIFYALDFVIEYIFCGKIENSNISLTINSFKETMNEEKTDDEVLRKFDDYWFYDSNELKELFKDLNTNIRKGIYNGRKLSKILQIISYLKNIGFDEKEIKKTFQVIKEHVTTDKKAIISNEVYINDPDVQLIFNKYFDELTKLQKGIKKSDYCTHIEDAFHGEDWGIDIYDYISNYKSIYYTDSFISCLNLDVLHDKYLKSSIKNIYYFKYTIDFFYQHCNFEILSGNEKVRLDDLKKMTLIIINDISDPMRINPLNLIVESIDEILQRFKN